MKREELEETIKQDLETRVREGVKALFEQILEEEMTQHLGAAPYQRSPQRRGRRNGEYERDLVTGVGTIHQLTVPRDREGTFQTELFERYRRLTGSVEEEQVQAWRERPLTEEYPYLYYLDATYLKANWGRLGGQRGPVTAVGVNTQAIESYWLWKRLPKNRPPASRTCCGGYRSKLERRAACGQRRSRGHQSCRTAELPGVAWQRCVVHFERNVLA